MPALLARQPGARLRIVGSSAPPEILALAGAAVEVLADAPSVEPYLDAAAVVVAPVRIGGGMRMKVLQALAAGKAVVTTSRGSEGFDCFEEPPPLAVADDADGFAADDRGAAGRRPAATANSAARARSFAETHYSPTAWASRLEALYAEAIAEDDRRLILAGQRRHSHAPAARGAAAGAARARASRPRRPRATR